MKIIDFMKKNKDKTFMFILYEGIVEDDGSITLHSNEDCSYYFEGYDAFVNFKSDNREMYKQVYKPLLKTKIGKPVKPYYLDNSSVVFAHMYLDGECYWANESYFEDNRLLREYLKEIVQECTDVA